MKEQGSSRFVVPALAALLSFSEGFPFGIVTELVPLYLRTERVSLTQIGLLSTLGLAWTYKVAWSPLIDLYGSYRRWIAGALVVIAISIAALGVIPPSSTMLFWAMVTLLVFASATQDIAADALTIRLTPNGLLGPVNSVRVAAYRGAMIVAGGGIAALTAWTSWQVAFFAAAAIAAVILALTTLMPRHTGEHTRHGNPFAGLRDWLRRPRAITILVVILLYKLGDFALQPMLKPFWVDAHYTAAEVGTVTTTVGLSFLIAGAMIGGLFVARFGIWPMLVTFGVLQILSNVVYAIVASMQLTARPWLYGATIFENVTWGLATAGFLSFLMSVCDPAHAATQYAMLSAMFGLPRSLIGAVSGVAADRLGYAPYFWITVLLGVPVLFLLPLIRGELLDRPVARTEQVLEG